MGVLGLKTSSLQGLGGALRFRVSPQSQLPVAKGIKLRLKGLSLGLKFWFVDFRGTRGMLGLFFFSWSGSGSGGKSGLSPLSLEFVVCLCWGFGVSYST